MKMIDKNFIAVNYDCVYEKHKNLIGKIFVASKNSSMVFYRLFQNKYNIAESHRLYKPMLLLESYVINQSITKETIIACEFFAGDGKYISAAIQPSSFEKIFKELVK